MSFGRLGHGSRSGALSSASCLAGPKGRLRPRQKRIGQADAQQEIHFAAIVQQSGETVGGDIHCLDRSIFRT